MCIFHRFGMALALFVAASPLVCSCLAAEHNFTVSGVDGARAAVIAEHAEAIRLEACSSLLRNDDPAPWMPRCVIHVHGSQASFLQTVGGHSAMTRGATSIEFSGNDVSFRRIDVLWDGDGEMPDALAHELVHVVLADRFTRFSPPRWADEGLATLFDSTAKQAGHEADFRRAHDAGRAFSVADILSLEQYPSSSMRQRVFYGQSAALARWLVARGGAARFVDFIDDACRGDVTAALRRHYGIESPASLDAAWKEVPQIQTLAFVGQVR